MHFATPTFDRYGPGEVGIFRGVLHDCCTVPAPDRLNVFTTANQSIHDTSSPVNQSEALAAAPLERPRRARAVGAEF